MEQIVHSVRQDMLRSIVNLEVGQDLAALSFTHTVENMQKWDSENCQAMTSQKEDEAKPMNV